MKDKQERDNYWNFSDVNDITSELHKIKPMFDWRRGSKTLLQWFELEVSDNEGDKNQSEEA